MTVNLSPVGGAAAQFFDNSGQVLTGGKIYTYLAGTTTPAITYTTSSGVTPQPNPIILNAAGRVPDSGEIWLTDGLLYKFVLKDQYDVQIAVWDNIDGINSNFVAFTVQNETATATQGQTVFTLSTIQYTPVTNNLAVYVNGSRQVITLNYTETSSNTVTFVSGLNVGDVVQFTTAAPVAANVSDAANVQYNEGQYGAVTRTVKVKLQESISVKDFGAVGDGVTDDSTAFSNAIDAIILNGGGSLYVPEGTYKVVSKIYKTVSNLTLHGDGMPWYNSTNTALTGGSIIQGSVQLIGNNNTVTALGIDCGSVVCTAINSGNPMDCLVLQDPTRALLYNCTVRDVITLCQSPTAAVHNFLLEGLSNSRFENLHAQYGYWGVVLKTQFSTADGLYAYNCSYAGFTLKSDTGVNGSPANTTTVSNVVVDNTNYMAALQGILIFANTEPLHDCSLTNFYIKGGVEGLKLVCDARAATTTNRNYNLAISNGTMTGQSIYGFTSFGACYDVVVSNLAIETASPTSLKVWDDCLGMTLNNIIATGNAFSLVNVDLAGRFGIDNIYSLVNSSFVLSAASGINLVPDNTYQSMSLGSYFGILYCSGNLATITLVNGWTAFSSTVTVNAKGNKTSLVGRVAVPSAPLTGKEQIGSIPAALAPTQPKYVIALGFSATGVVTPIFIDIQPTGTITATYLNTVAAFPASIVWVGLDGISWTMPE